MAPATIDLVAVREALAAALGPLHVSDGALALDEAVASGAALVVTTSAYDRRNLMAAAAGTAIEVRDVLEIAAGAWS